MQYFFNPFEVPQHHNFVVYFYQNPISQQNQNFRKSISDEQRDQRVSGQLAEDMNQNQITPNQNIFQQENIDMKDEKNSKEIQNSEKQFEKLVILNSLIKKGKKQKKLGFEMKWGNENRNIVPNIMNQLISFVVKPSKSGRLTGRLFGKCQAVGQWSMHRFYVYMKLLRNEVDNYMDESTMNLFLVVQQPSCQIYSLDEQHFYMKICRLLVLHFLTSESILISLSSRRMSTAKRTLHLVARRALLQCFHQIAL